MNLQTLFRICLPLDELNERYRFLGLIGHGRHADVNLYECRRTKELFAVREYQWVPKYVRFNFLDEVHKIGQLQEEWSFMPRLCGVVQDHRNQGLESFQVKAIFQYAQSLEDRMRKHPEKYTMFEIINTIRFILHPLKKLAKRAQAHGNLKPSNIHFVGGQRVMLSDLRLSKPDMQIEHLYMAPEIQQFIEEQKFYPNKLTEEQIGKTDVWVLGLIMVMMATNYSKFDAQSIDVQCLFTDMDLMVQLGELHEEFYKLCSDMMNLDPKRRLSLKETETRLRLAEKKILEGQESSDEEQKVEHDHFYYERKRLYKKIRQIEKQSLLNLNKIRHGDEDALFWRNWDMVENYPFWWTEQSRTFHGHLLQPPGNKSQSKAWRCYECWEVIQETRRQTDAIRHEIMLISF